VDSLLALKHSAHHSVPCTVKSRQWLERDHELAACLPFVVGRAHEQVGLSEHQIVLLCLDRALISITIDRLRACAIHFLEITSHDPSVGAYAVELGTFVPVVLAEFARAECEEIVHRFWGGFAKKFKVDSACVSAVDLDVEKAL